MAQTATAQATTPIRKLLDLIYEDRREFFSVLLLSAVNSVLFLTVPLVAQGLVNVVVSGLYLQPLIVLTGALLAGLLAAGLLTILRFYLVEVMRERIFARVALRVAQRLPKVRHKVLVDNNGQELMNRFFDVVNVQKSWFKLAYEGPGAVLEILVGLTLLAFYGTELFGLASAFLLAGSALVLLFGYRGLTTSLVESSEKYRVAEWLEEMVKCHESMKVNCRNDFWSEEVDRRVVSFLLSRRRHFGILIRQKAVYYLLAATSLSGVLGLGGYLVVQGQLTLGQLVAAELVLWGILKASQKLIGLTESFYDLLTGLEKVGVITSMEIDTPGTAPVPGGAGGLSVVVDGLYFNYDREAPPLLQGLDFKVEPGEFVTILGDPGSGRSTLMKILTGFLYPKAGVVELDEVDIRELSPDSLAGNVGVYSERAELFTGTVLENVALGRPVSLHRVKEILEFCDARTLLGGMERGAESLLTGAGSKLSESERESLLLARALAARPRLLLLDGTLGALSERQQAHLAQSLSSLRDSCSVVSTSPSPEMVGLSHTLYLMEGGRLQSLGNPREMSESAWAALQNSFPNLATVLRARMGGA